MVESAPAGARPFLQGAREQFGFVPAPMAKMAASPSLLQAFARGNAIFEESSLGPVEREVVIMTVGVFNGCHYCVPMHTAIMQRMGAPPALIEALRAGGRIEDLRLAVLAAFTRRVLEGRGEVGDDALAAFFDAGYTRQQALDVVVGVSVFTLTNYAIRLTAPKLDDAFAAFAWSPQAG